MPFEMIAQAAVPIPDAPSASTLALVLLAFLAGSSVPTYYAQERLRGAGRALMARLLPYQPPPGQDRETAMIEATDPAGDRADEGEQDGSNGGSEP